MRPLRRPFVIAAAIVGTLTACRAVAAPPSGGKSGSSEAILGTWSVVATPIGPTGPGTVCPDPQKALVYQWLLAVQPTGLATATVQGETGYPKLVGHFEKGLLRMFGRSGSAVSTFELAVRDGQLVGTRTWIGASGDGKPTMCVWSVTAKR